MIKYESGKVIIIKNLLYKFFLKLKSLLDAVHADETSRKNTKQLLAKSLKVSEMLRKIEKLSTICQIYMKVFKIPEYKNIGNIILDKINCNEFNKFIKILIPEFTDAYCSNIFLYLVKLNENTSELQKENVKSKRKSSKSSDLSSTERKNISLHDLGKLYESFIKEHERINNTLSNINLKLKKREFKRLLLFWKNYSEKLNEKIERQLKKEKAIYTYFAKFKDTFHIGANSLEDIVIKFNDFVKQKDEVVKKIKHLFNFCLSTVYEEENITIENFEKLMKGQLTSLTKEHQSIQGLIKEIKQNCVLRKDSFSFYDIPDLMIKQPYNEMEYHSCIKYLNKVKKRYLKLNQKELNQDVNQLNVSIDDLVPLSLLDEVFLHIKFKAESNLSEVDLFFKACQNETNSKINQLEVSNEYNLKKISNNILLTVILTRLENMFISYKLSDFKIRKLHNGLNLKQFNKISDIVGLYEEMMNINEENIHFTKFMVRFNTFIHSSGMKEGNPKSITISKTFENDSFSQKNTSNKTPIDKDENYVLSMINKQTTASDKKREKEKEEGRQTGNLSPTNLAKLNEDVFETESEKEVDEEELIRKDEEKKHDNLFRSKDGKKFNPMKKYGSIEDDYLVYEPKTTSIYPHIKPAEHYHSKIIDSSPSPEKKWYLREHHCQTLTKTKKSIPDDVMNTKYHSFYLSYPKEDKHPEIQLTKDTLKSLENHLGIIKSKIEILEKQKIAQGIPLDKIKPEKPQGIIMDEKSTIEALKKIESEIEANNPGKGKLVSDSYESIMLMLRRKEREIILKKRNMVYEKNRPPLKDWYKLKTPDFIDEFKRNSLIIGSSDIHFKFLEMLNDKTVY